MTRTIINYTTFKSSEDFVAWQSEGEVKKVHQVQPQLIEMGLDLTETDGANDTDKRAQGEGVTKFGIFVTYLTEIEDDPSY